MLPRAFFEEVRWAVRSICVSYEFLEIEELRLSLSRIVNLRLIQGRYDYSDLTL